MAAGGAAEAAIPWRTATSAATSSAVASPLMEKRAELITEYEDTLANPYLAAERGYIDAVIHPHETRSEVVRALRLLRSKRETLPPKKHGNIPL